MSHLPPLVADNILLLEQCATVVEALTADEYRSRDPRCLGGSVGAHVRHSLEHYGSFLAGLDVGDIDYARRARDRRVEEERAFACAALRATASALARHLTFAPMDGPLIVAAEGEAADGDPTRSSIGRELGFLLSHTIHHCALIAVLMRLRGLETPSGFGLAPATLRHRGQAQTTQPLPSARAS
jgi:uncharacterized damage-inducible protein DinB